MARQNNFCVPLRVASFLQCTTRDISTVRSFFFIYIYFFQFCVWSITGVRLRVIIVRKSRKTRYPRAANSPLIHANNYFYFVIQCRGIISNFISSRSSMTSLYWKKTKTQHEIKSKEKKRDPEEDWRVKCGSIITYFGNGSKRIYFRWVFVPTTLSRSSPG